MKPDGIGLKFLDLLLSVTVSGTVDDTSLSFAWWTQSSVSPLFITQRSVYSARFKLLM